MKKMKIVICHGSSCYNRGNNHILEVIKKYLRDSRLEEKVDFKGQLCSGNCSHGPVLHINDITYKEIDEIIAVQLLDELFADLKK